MIERKDWSATPRELLDAHLALPAGVKLDEIEWSQLEPVKSEPTHWVDGLAPYSAIVIGLAASEKLEHGIRP